MYDTHPSTDDTSYVLLKHVFGDLTELMRVLAPDGRDKSTYSHIHNLTIEQQHAELVRINEGMLC